jgi:hypothetical protein
MSTPDSAAELELAAGLLDPSDAALFNSIRAVYDERDPVPDGLVERIQFELTLDALHTEVATLMQLESATAGVRGGSATESVRTVTFTSDSLTTMVTITPQPDRTVRVDGWAAPGAGVRVELLGSDGSQETTADEDGRFVFEGVQPGLAKFVLYVLKEGGPATVVSPAIEL